MTSWEILLQVLVADYDEIVVQTSIYVSQALTSDCPAAVKLSCLTTAIAEANVRAFYASEGLLCC